MNLETWMRERNLTDQVVGEAIGVTRAHIARIRYGTVHPSLAVALKIWNYTNRSIALESMLPKQLRDQHAVAPVMPLPPEPPVEETPRMLAARRALKSRASA